MRQGYSCPCKVSMPAPTGADAHGDRGRVSREGGIGWLCLCGEDACQQAETRDGHQRHAGTTP